MSDQSKIRGVFTVECRDAAGNFKWSEQFPNLIATLGKNLMLDKFLETNAFTQTGPYMGLISSASFSTIAAADTMASHAGWLEAGSANAPTYSGSRKTCAWSAAASGAKALSAGLTFTFTGTGTVKGAFIVLGPSASATIANASGVLFSAGLLAIARDVVSTETLTVSYQVSLT